MKNTLLAIYFFIFLIHQVLEKIGFKNSFLDSYLDDFLFLPLFLFSIEFIISTLSKQEFSLNFKQTLFTIALAMINVELIFPLFSNRFVFDYWDFISYGLGYIFYIGILNYSKHDKIKIT